jgi:hypothetical protein
VRRETGTINRAIYEIAFLHTPGTPLPEPWNEQGAWNGGLVYSFGGGCGAGFRQGRAPSSLSDAILSLGYASASSSLNVFGNNCNDVISAETLMMVKEHFIKQFGVPAYTIGMGGSGGSMQQHLIAQNYPGLLDGIIPGGSYPDITTVISSTVDCSLLNRAFEASGLGWTDEQKTAVAGYATWRTCESWMKSFSPRWLQPQACAAPVSPAMAYDVKANPKGARCSIYDNQVNIYGRDPATGFARRPFDNSGVQYGLAAFNAGTISAEQFVTLNERTGGYDADGNLSPNRTSGDPGAIRTAYETGRVLRGTGMAAIPIIDFRAYRDQSGDIHDSIRSLITRARLMASNGNAANHVILTARPADNAAILRTMQQWIENIEKDSQHGNAASRVVRNKPIELTDACWAENQAIVEPRTAKGTGRCAQLYPPHENPRMAAGGPLTDDVLKCSLKPVNPRDYKQSLTESQLSRLKAVFPAGVCDYTRPGIGQMALRGTWLRY